ncbi:hypothetical protein [Streptomyces colonosanans]|uniref:Uncharacterized protein n=1 Tax=Streptomyces colonosanans TaxID=1428652 RepID=A0A1S2PET1_9ACTN|nr:hypothetical protein BIV24_15110 [Streptomyces colonosanans]
MGLGSTFVGTGGTALSLPLPLPLFEASPLVVGPGPRLPVALLGADAEGAAEVPDADAPGLEEPPLTATPPAPLPSPPLAVGPPSGAAPPRRPAECAGVGLPASSPTLMQPAVAATAITVAASRTDR